MGQRAVISFFTRKELEVRTVHTELEPVYGPEALVPPTVRKWRRRFHSEETDLFDGSRSGRPLTNDLVGSIGSILQERLFSSCKVLCRHFRIGKVTCFRILHSKLRLKSFHFAEYRMQYQSKERRNVIFEASFDGAAGTEGERL
jgi:hypothetical protein